MKPCFKLGVGASGIEADKSSVAFLPRLIAEATSFASLHLKKEIWKFHWMIVLKKLDLMITGVEEFLVM